jgi:hypothetical protein
MDPLDRSFEFGNTLPKFKQIISPKKSIEILHTTYPLQRISLDMSSDFPWESEDLCTRESRSRKTSLRIVVQTASEARMADSVWNQSTAPTSRWLHPAAD